jgi:hypothetical protein
MDAYEIPFEEGKARFEELIRDLLPPDHDPDLDEITFQEYREPRVQVPYVYKGG